MINDEKIIQIAKDRVQDWYLNKGHKKIRDDIYLLDFKTDSLHTFFNLTLGVLGETDIFTLVYESNKYKISFKHYDPGNQMYIGSGK